MKMDIYELVRGDLITCAWYYDHKMKCFHKLWQSIDTLFGQLQDYFFVTKLQARGSEHDHGFLWIKDAPIYGINNNDEIESFVDKYIICDKYLLFVNLCESQLHYHKWACQ